MAPWPEQDNEPKAPDKNEKCEHITSLDELNSKAGNVENSEYIVQNTRSDQNVNSTCAKTNDDKEVLSSLDEGGLKALLDEALGFKNPNDLKDKSELFKKLLKEVKADESESKGTEGTASGKIPRYYNFPAKRRHHRHPGRDAGTCLGPSGVGVSNTRGGSLQNIHALSTENPRVRGRRSATGARIGDGGQTLVSARQREGGSLPSNVNVQGREVDTEMDSVQCTEMICNYTSRATLEVVADNKKEDANSNVDLTVAFPLTANKSNVNVNGVEQNPLQLGSGYNSVKSLVGGMNAADANYILVDSIKLSDGNHLVTLKRIALDNDTVVMQHLSVLSIQPHQILVGSDSLGEDGDDKGASKKWGRNRNKKGSHPSSNDEDESDRTVDQTLFNLPQWNSYGFTLVGLRDPLNRGSYNKDVTSESKIKSVDENGNAVATVKVDPYSNDRKNKRRLKTKNDHNTVLSQNIEGYRGEEDLDTVIKFIESPSGAVDAGKTNKTQRTGQNNGTRGNCKVRVREEEARQGKRRTKDSSGKLQKSNSLEEISKTKLEDLTEEGSGDRSGSGTGIRARPKKQATLDDAQLGNRGTLSLTSWDDQTYSDETLRKRKDKKADGSNEAVQDSEFHVVTKKQRKKKRRTGCSSRTPGTKTGNGYYGNRGFPPHDRTVDRENSGGLLYRYRRSGGSKNDTHPRRKSASSVPPSDKSDSSDLDSVHSLPVSSTTSRTRIAKSPASGGSTPQASYADIARSVASPPRAVSQGNICRRQSGNKISPASTAPSSAASSGGGDEESVPSPEPPPIISFTVPSPLTCVKKDAMTDTTCDTVLPPLPKEEYPPLEKKTTASDFFVEFTVKRNRNMSNRENCVSVEETVVLKTVPNKTDGLSESLTVVVTPSNNKTLPVATTTSKRPPVILMDDPVHCQAVTELTFGFEVNQQLLCDGDNCNISKDPSVLTASASNPSVHQSSSDDSVSSVDNIVDYIGLAWEDVVKELTSGKVHYYTGQ